MSYAKAGESLPVPNVQALAQTYIKSDEQIPERYFRVEEAAEEAINGRDIALAIPIIDLKKLVDPQSSKEECAKLGQACNQWGFFQIPERYVRVEEAAEEVISGHDIAFAIPIIDLKKLVDQSSKEECAKLGLACNQWGFFQLINHGVPEEVLHNFRSAMTEFFKQPLEAKEVYSIIPGSLDGYGQHFVVSENQKLEWGDLFHLILRPSDSRDKRIWPSIPPSFRNSIDRYSSDAATLATCLLKFLAIDMGVDPETFLERFRGEPQSMRMNYYPPCRQADKVLGLSPHTDGGGLTLLLQVNDVQGLQIRMDGKWLNVNALDGAIIVNVGDMLEILSNGRYKSIEHRAVVHPTKERMSAALFHTVCQDTVVGPLPELVKSDGVARYSSTSYMDFFKGYFAAKLDGRSYLESLKN